MRRVSAGPDLKSVKLSAQDAADARRILAHIARQLDGPLEESPLAVGAGWSSQRESLLGMAREMLERRLRRTEHFGKAMFGEPAWDMLLSLYTLEGDAQQTVNQLTEHSGAPRSTAVRWLEYLEQQQLVCREPHPTDKRTAIVNLTQKGRSNLELFLAGTAQNED